jgi:putative sterol carrier protein
MGAGPPSPAALAEMQKLNGMIRMEVTGAEGGDWSVAFKIGPGPIPEQATTTITMSAADAEALERGELDPMQAFMSGRMRVAGDMTLMMQMQAIQMQVAAQQAAQKGSA